MSEQPEKILIDFHGCLTDGRMHIDATGALRDKSKVPFSNFIALGDDAWDMAMLTQAERAYCPADADPQVQALPKIRILKTAGGHGVVAEMLGAELKIANPLLKLVLDN
jgi:3-deoxy-D-manno-octulosonate 8-phosphate phosphatase KdsC-like HAD superfamily phosphatase